MPNFNSQSYHLVVVAVRYKKVAVAIIGSQAYAFRDVTPDHPKNSVIFRISGSRKRMSLSS